MKIARNLSVGFALWLAGLAQAEPFNFTPVLFADRSEVVASETVTASTAGNLSIAGGEYSINGGSFGSGPATVNAGDTITVRQTSSSRYNTMTSAVLIAEGTASSFDVTTGIPQRVSATTGSVLIAGGTVTVTPTVNDTPPPPGCGATAAPYVLGPGDSYTFRFRKPPAMVLIPTGFSDSGGSLHYTVDGNPRDPHSFTIAGRLSDSSCGPDTVSTSSDGSGFSIVQATGATSSGVLRARPLLSIKLSNSSSTPVAFGIFVMPKPGTDDDASGTSDLFLSDAAGSQVMGLHMNGLTATPTSPLSLRSPGWKPVRISDMIGGGGTDVLWQNDDGRAMLSYPALSSTAQGPIPVLGSGDWKVVAAGDLDGDGVDDLVFQNADGSVAAWTMAVQFDLNTTYQRSSGATILGPGTGWSVVRLADFDGDGKADILWKHEDGRHAIWLMNGITPVATAEILGPGSWQAVQVGDLDGDGKADIVWQNSDGTIAAWLMDGVAPTGGATLLAAGSGWMVTHVGDFNGDGTSDLLFRHTDGRAAIWLMNGLAPISQAEILPAGTGWTATRIGDFNADQSMDIAWQHDDGRVAVWLMDGTSLLGSKEVLGPGTGWILDRLGP